MTSTSQSAAMVDQTNNRDRQRLTDATLDSILAWQITIAWAGEGECEPKRLGWWRTDLIDEAGGGDLFQRMFPKTHAWAALEAVRQVAIQHDQRKRQRSAQPDAIQTLFFWGFSIDEQLVDRLAVLKRGQKSPETSLDLPLKLDSDFVISDLEAVLKIPGQSIDYEVVPDGRQLKGEPSPSQALRARNLAAALLPLKEDYSMPFYRMGVSHGS